MEKKMTNVFKELKAPFHPNDIKTRKAFGGNKKILHYIDARTVMERLDLVVGEANWQSDVTSADGKTICKLSIRIDDEWIHKTDGAGDTGIEADKGAISDAFKRAAVLFGIGRYLYEGTDPTDYYNNYHKNTSSKKSRDKKEEFDLIKELKKCKSVEDLEDYRKKYLDLIKASDNKDEIRGIFKELRTKFSGE